MILRHFSSILDSTFIDIIFEYDFEYDIEHLRTN